jgi:hypothetical protein
VVPLIRPALAWARGERSERLDRALPNVTSIHPA